MLTPKKTPATGEVYSVYGQAIIQAMEEMRADFTNASRTSRHLTASDISMLKNIAHTADQLVIDNLSNQGFSKIFLTRLERKLTEIKGEALNID